MMARRAPPDREGDAPVALPRDTPVPQVGRPIELTRRSGPVREPSDPPDLLDHLWLEVGHLQEPLDRRAEQDRGLATPTMAVRMEDRLVCEEGVGRPEVRDNPRIRLPHLLARVGACVRRETASRVDGGEGGKAELLTELEILRPVSRCRMDEPC